MDFTEFSLSKAKIHRGKLLENIQEIKKLLSSSTKFMAVIKADAYGHGASQLAQKIESEKAVNYFGVAQLAEALELREDGIQTATLVFNHVRKEEIKLAIQNKITMTVFSKKMAKAITETAKTIQKTALIHLKIDTGMGRVGARNFKDAYDIYELLNSDFVKIEGIYTHFADADKKSPNNFSHKQFNSFKKIIDQFHEKEINFELRHAANTAATINYPDYHLDMVRVGIGIYGFNPTQSKLKKIKLQPIQNIYTRVTHVKNFPASHSIGYNRHYYSTEKMKVATIGIGYADGVPLSLSNKAYFRYHGKKLPIVGDVCMDQIMLDSSSAPKLKIGDLLSYFGDPAEGHSSASEIAKIINGSPYELLCRIGNRVERIYQ
ncbi:MAG: alanine racemase, partial [Atopostipes sp.]|nr:alanine racemase [Atopostipes sp.]